MTNNQTSTRRGQSRWRVLLPTLVVGALVAGVGVAAPTGPPSPADGPRTESLSRIALENQARTMLAKATARGRLNCDAAEKTLKRILDDPDFKALSPETRSSTLQLGIMCSEDVTDEATLDLARSLDPIAANPAGRAVASYPILIAVLGKDDRAAAQRMILIADGMPELVSRWEGAWIWPMVRATEDDGPLSLTLLTRLIGIDWQDSGARAATAKWRVMLAARQAEMNNRIAVRETLGPVEDLENLLAVAIDRRFEPEWADMQAAGRFDWLALARSDLARHRKAMEADPRNLQAIVLVVDDLRALGRHEEAITLLEAARTRMQDPKAFDDHRKSANWLLNELAYALSETGRPDEADAVWKDAVAAGTAKGDKVSQYVNYAAFLTRRGRNAEAVAVLERVDRDASSPVGKSFQESGLVCALSSLDPARADRLMAELMAHWEDHPPAVSAALICLDRQDAAAEMMIRRLGTPRYRSEALRAAIISIPDPGATEWDRALTVRRQAVFARPDVARALDAVGRRLTLPIHAVYWGNE